MSKAIDVGSFCELRIYSDSGRLEIFDVTVVEICSATVVRVQLWNGNILRVMCSQLKAF